MTRLYLIRHGIAADRGTYSRDEERPLTEEGERKTRLVAKRLKQLEIHFDLILTSPLIRASQTSEILRQTELCDRVEVSDFLAPEGSLQDWLNWLQAWKQSGNAQLAIVGHEPDLSHWAEQLLWGEVRDCLTLKKAGLIGLELPDSGAILGRCQMFWLTAPRLLL